MGCGPETVCYAHTPSIAETCKIECQCGAVEMELREAGPRY